MKALVLATATAAKKELSEKRPSAAKGRPPVWEDGDCEHERSEPLLALTE